MQKLTKQNNAAKWMLEGIKQHNEFDKLFRLAKDRALSAGMFFLSAKEGSEHGEWMNFLSGYAHQIPERTVRSYMSFASDAIEWAKQHNPKLLGMEKISAAAREVVLQSPKSFTDLVRQLKHFRKFGEYDEVRYKTKKLLGGKQFEFQFADLAASVDVLTHFGDHGYQFRYPDGVDTVEYMETVETKLEAALKRVREIKKNGRIIET